ncbi:hypothetical protein D3C87_1635930 [compost metagenome]
MCSASARLFCDLARVVGFRPSISFTPLFRLSSNPAVTRAGSTCRLAPLGTARSAAATSL